MKKLLVIIPILLTIILPMIFAKFPDKDTYKEVETYTEYMEKKNQENVNRIVLTLIIISWFAYALIITTWQS